MEKFYNLRPDLHLQNGSLADKSILLYIPHISLLYSLSLVLCILVFFFTCYFIVVPHKTVIHCQPLHFALSFSPVPEYNRT